MKLAITGEGSKLPFIQEQLEQAGIECMRVNGTQELREIVPTLPALVYISCDPPRFIKDESYQMNVIHGLSAKDEIVFLLDAAADNDPYDFYLMFDAARNSARMMRPVTVLSRSVRANYPGAEEKYAEAREAGVRFMHYDDVEIEQGDNGVQKITVTDGADTYVIETPCLIDCTPGCGAATLELAEALKLKLYKNRYITGGHWFDHNRSTSRRNVFVVYDQDVNNGSELGTLVQDILHTADKARFRIAMVDKTKCAFCYTCNRICPHGAAMPDLEARAMYISRELCAGCGACVNLCPAEAISWDEPRDLVESDKSILVLCCENSALTAASSALEGMNVQIDSIPCGGVVSSRILADALKRYKGVLVAVCINGACKHYEGNLRAIASVNNIKRELEELGLDPSRVDIVQAAGSMENILHDAVERFEGRISEE